MSDPGRRDVRFYFDFVSPYSWIALMGADRFAREHRVRWDLRPIVYAKLLDAHGLTGPGEVAARRRYLFADVVRAAAAAGLEVAGPPAHPFRSLEALRAFCLYREDPDALRLAAAIADAAWAGSRDLTDVGVLAGVVREAGFAADDLAGRIAAPEVKSALRDLTREALDAGLFGVPSFVVDGELFWGQDRMSHLADRLAGRLADPRPRAAELSARPRGADRPGAQQRRDPPP